MTTSTLGEAFLGLGAMGRGMTERLLGEGHHVMVWNRSPQPVAEVTAHPRATAAESIEEAFAACSNVHSMLSDDRVVLDVFNDDPAMVAFFQRLIGYSLTGQPDEDIIVILYGNGSNGKSTVLGTLRHVLGKYARMAQSETFLSQGKGAPQAGAPREDLLRLRGARFVYIIEPDAECQLREGLIKSMTGGEALPARGVRGKNTVEVRPTWTSFIATNHLPVIKGADHAIWRRLMPIPFTRNFDQDPKVTKDLHRNAALRQESEGILRWGFADNPPCEKVGVPVL